MKAMKKEITRLTQLIQEEAPLHKQVPKANSSSRVGEFERHTKGFGLKYMNKYGFEKGKRLGRNEKGSPQTIPFVKNNKTATLGTNGGLVNITTPIRKGNGKTQGTSYVKFVKGGTTCDEGAKIFASSSRQDKFQALSKINFKTQELSSHVSFYADYVLTRNHRDKVVAKFVGHRTWNTRAKSHVWVPKVLITNTLGPSIVGYLKGKSDLIL
jgi:hypothetical protein